MSNANVGFPDPNFHFNGVHFPLASALPLSSHNRLLSSPPPTHASSFPLLPGSHSSPHATPQATGIAASPHHREAPPARPTSCSLLNPLLSPSSTLHHLTPLLLLNPRRRARSRSGGAKSHPWWVVVGGRCRGSGSDGHGGGRWWRAATAMVAGGGSPGCFTEFSGGHSGGWRSSPLASTSATSSPWRR
jgi:hypothetical protein